MIIELMLVLFVES